MLLSTVTPLLADLLLFCYARDFMVSLSYDKQADIIGALNTTSRYFDDILNINNVYFDNIVSQIYPPECQLKKAYTSDIKAVLQCLNGQLIVFRDMLFLSKNYSYYL